MDYEEKRVVIGSCIIEEYVGENMEKGNEDEIKDDKGGNDVEISRIVVLIVDERMSNIETVEVSRWEVPKDSLFNVP